MSYSCNKCGKFLFAPGRCSRCAAPETLVRTKSELEVITAERDRLAAENAELKARYLHVAELNHNQVSMVRADRAALAAANATLDELRELCGPNKTISNRTCMKMVDILYPQPAALAEENDNGN